MKKPSGHRVPTRNLNIFLLLSIAFHVLLSIVLILIPIVRIEKLSKPNLEVFLLRLISEENPPSKILSPKLKTIKKEENQWSHPEEEEEPLSQKGLETEPHLPIQAEEPKFSFQQTQEEESETETIFKSADILSPPGLDSYYEVMATIALPSNSDSISKDIYTPPLLIHMNPQDGLGNISKPPSPSSDADITFTQPKYVENPKPFYPQEARKKGYQGEVMLKVEVLVNGQVGWIEVKKSSGYKLLDESATTAVKQWKFIPAKKGKETVPFWVNIPVKFRLQ
jgi:TonB family protein